MLIDEASQTTEPSVLMPLAQAGKRVQHVVLVGDHKQLPPVICYDQEQFGHKQTATVSLMQRLIEQTDVQPFILAKQRRMHSLVSA